MAESVKRPRAAKPKIDGEAKAKAPTPKSTVSARPTTTGGPTHEQIAELARKYWAQRGHTDGRHEEDWFRAEKELRAKAS